MKLGSSLTHAALVGLVVSLVVTQTLNANASLVGRDMFYGNAPTPRAPQAAAAAPAGSQAQAPLEYFNATLRNGFAGLALEGFPGSIKLAPGLNAQPFVNRQALITGRRMNGTLLIELVQPLGSPHITEEELAARRGGAAPAPVAGGSAQAQRQGTFEVTARPMLIRQGNTYIPSLRLQSGEIVAVEVSEGVDLLQLQNVDTTLSIVVQPNGNWKIMSARAAGAAAPAARLNEAQQPNGIGYGSCLDTFGRQRGNI